MNKYDIQAKIDAIRGDAERQLRAAQMLFDIAATDEARDFLNQKRDRIAAIDDGSLFHQQPDLISISAPIIEAPINFEPMDEDDSEIIRKARDGKTSRLMQIGR